jgi:hypothetical protein
MTEQNKSRENEEKIIKKNNSRKIKIGDTTYIVSSNFVPTRQNKDALIKVIQHLMKNARKPDL